MKEQRRVNLHDKKPHDRRGHEETLDIDPFGDNTYKTDPHFYGKPDNREYDGNDPVERRKK